MRSHLPALAVLTALTALSACSDGTDPTKDCPTNVEVTVSPGTKPEFSWTPACRAYQVGVNSGTGLVWAMGFKPGNPAKANAIASPVTFGDSLSIGDTLLANPVTELTPGQTYTFHIIGLNAVGQSVPMGDKTFTP